MWIKTGNQLAHNQRLELVSFVSNPLKLPAFVGKHEMVVWWSGY